VTDPHDVLNALTSQAANTALVRCCGSKRWVRGMLALRPFDSTPALFRAARDVWSALSESDYLEAFEHHPPIGSDLATLAAKFPATAGLAGREQGGVQGAAESTLLALRDGNLAYRQKFGFLFIVCATGKSAVEMLAILRGRLGNDRATELRIATGEQAKITELRLQKMTT
jgi:2-oxo-4-hydroxy-4-carboxy-5-ureidoimidazoline decarboxylase